MDFLDDESDDESEAYKLFGGKEGIVFLIDSTEPMFDCQQFSLAIECIESVMKNKAIASPSDELAIILFGTELTSNKLSFDHIFIAQTLKTTSVENILDLKNLRESDVRSKFGHNNKYSLADVFETALSEFTKSKSKFQTKRVILFTCCCDPHSGDTKEDKHLNLMARIRAKDFKDHNIDLELIPLISKDNEEFNFEDFYESIIPELKDNKCDPFVKCDALMHRIYNKSHRKRMLASIPFRLGPWGQQNNASTDVKISVYVYTLCLETKKPFAVKTSRKDFREVKTETQRWTQDIGEIVKSEDVRKKYEFGNESIYLSKQDIKTSSNFEEPALTLLGFKPRTALKLELHIKGSQFIYPNDNSIKGSSTLFNALLKRCAERDKVAICRFTMRRSAQPRLVALYPQIESKPLGKSGGFHVIYLPYKDDIRQLDIKGAEACPVRTDAIDFAKNIVEKLSFSYDPKDFPNPVLQTHWRAIEALALNYEKPEPFDDSQTQPNYEDIESKAGYDLYSLNQLLGGYLVVSNEKKVKVYEDLKLFIQNNNLGSLTVAELKEFCRRKDIKCGSKKAECIEAIRSYYKN